MLRSGTSSRSSGALPSTSGGSAGNGGCYVRALSDQPQAFMSGFNKASRRLKKGGCCECTLRNQPHALTSDFNSPSRR